MLRVLGCWLGDTASYVTPAARPRVVRPEGMEQLPVPRVVKDAHQDMACGLCGDPVKTGELVGRTRTPKDLAVHRPMGWLCAHCLYTRRQTPRRRDVAMRAFHALFAGSAVDLNAYECQVLLTWLTEDPACAASSAWHADPLENTLTRMATSVAEKKAATWIAVPTFHTITAVLHQAPSSPAEQEMLNALAQHLTEWTDNPQGVERRRYGSGPRFRARVLEVTCRPTLLSRQGGPFDLHHAPAPRTEEPMPSTDAMTPPRASDRFKGQL